MSRGRQHPSDYGPLAAGVEAAALQDRGGIVDVFPVKNRPGEHARQMLRDAQIRTIRKNALVWVCLILIAVILTEVLLVEPIPATFRAFLLGFLAASTLACFGWMVFVMSGSYSRSMGKLGEEATAEAVTSWRRRGRDGGSWTTYLATHGDIDHVLVGPGGVYAIESKWTCGCQEPHPRHATRRYSWMSPPSRSVRLSREGSTSLSTAGATSFG